MNILFLSRWYPQPPNNGSKIRILNLLRSLAERHQVSLVSFVEPQVDRCANNHAVAIDHQELIPFRDFRPFSLRALLALVSPTPRSFVDTRSTEMETAIRRCLSRKSFDLVIASQTWMASYRDCFAGVPSIFEEVELGLFRHAHHTLPAGLRRMLPRITWIKHCHYMRRLVTTFRACTVASSIEQALLNQVCPNYDAIYIVPNGLDMSNYAQVSVPRHNGVLVFAGALSYWPNHEAMTWFLREVYPIVKFAAPFARVVITGDFGRHPLPPAPGVTLTGPLTDVRPVVASAAVSICPLRSGGGTRLKLLEAMALRTPVVATSKAVEGLDVTADRHLLIADDAAEFADAVLRLLHNPVLSQQLAEDAYDLVLEKYDWKAIEPHWLKVIEHAAYVGEQRTVDPAGAHLEERLP